MKLKPLIEQVVRETRGTEETQSTLRFLWKAYKDNNKDLLNKIVDNKFNGHLPPNLVRLLRISQYVQDFVTAGLNDISPEEITINAHNTKFRVAKIDATHLKMTTSETSWGNASVSHIGELRDKPYYEDLKTWLKGYGNPDGKTY